MAAGFLSTSVPVVTALSGQELIYLAGWLLSVVALSGFLVYRWRIRSRLEAAVRACHELRNPLTAARLSLTSLERAESGDLSRVRAVEGELARATLALEDLSAAVHGHQRSTFGSNEVDIDALLEDTVTAWQPVAKAYGAELQLGSGSVGTVSGDRLRLAQACSNLVANALEHGGGKVCLQARYGAGRLRIEVLDQGPGLPAPVSKMVRHAKHGKGTRGRGLAIAADIAECHGGRLATAPTESGARLVLDLPVSGVAA